MMSFKTITFELSEEQIKDRLELAKTLAKESEIIAFCEAYNCPFDILEAHASRFKTWLQDKRKAESYTYDDLIDNPEKGAYLNLVYDSETNILEQIYTQVPLVSQIKDDLYYLEQYQIFDLGLNLRNAHFDHLDLSNESANYLRILLELKSFIDNKDLGHYLYGDLGVGKSYLAACVANDFAKAGKRVAFVHVPSLFNRLKQLFNNSSEMEFVLNVLRKVPLLVLDDLGSESITSWSRDEILLSVMNDRLENQRKTIITSNTTPEILLNLYSLDSKGNEDKIRAARFVDRVKALTKPYELKGKNRRKRL